MGLKEPMLFLAIYSVWALVLGCSIEFMVSNMLECDPKDAACGGALGKIPRPYMVNYMRLGSEFALTVIITLPCLTAPYMLAEFVQTKKIRCFGLLEPLSRTVIFVLHVGNIFFVFAMGALIKTGAGVWSISNAELFGEKGIIVYIPFNSLLRSLQMVLETQCTKHDMDLDIAGPGVRLSTYVLLGFTNLSLTLGSLHAGTTGTKELGVCTLLNLFGMSCNLMKLKKNSLSPTETFLIIAIMDAQMVGLAATLSSKDALASRLYVRLTIVCEITAWLSVLVFGHSLGNLERYAKGSVCCVPTKGQYLQFPDGQVYFVRPFLPDVGRQCDFPMRFATSFSYYWYSHGLVLAHTLWLAHHHMAVFDSLEKLSTIRHTDHNLASTNIFASIPATAFGNWRSSFFHSIFVMIALEQHLTAIDESNWAEWQAWGQSLTLVVCIGGLWHWLYVNRKLIIYLFTWGRYGLWPSVGTMFHADVVRLIAMGLPTPELSEEDRNLLATGRVHIDTPIADMTTAEDLSSLSSEVSGTTRPIVSRMISADIADQRLMGVSGTSKTE